MTIWDSIDDLQGHPLLFKALNTIKGKVEHCQSRSYYDSSDDVTDHRTALLSLRGRFSVAQAGTELAGDVYAECGADGITFNRALVMASTAYFNGDDAKDDLTTESYLALFEQTIEHELAHHFKMHQERSFAPDTGTSPDHSERHARAPPKAAPILKVSEGCVDRNFAPPLDLYRVPLSDFNDEETNVVSFQDPLSLEELRRHMTNDCPKRARESTAATESSTGKRSKMDDGDKPADPSSSSQRSRRMGSAREGQDQSRTDEAGQDRDEKRTSKRIPDFHGRSSQSCQVQVVFCDQEQSEKTTFQPTESIYVLLTFKNRTQSDAYVKVPKVTFQRGAGIFMAIDGCPMKTPHVDTDLAFQSFGFLLVRSTPFFVFCAPREMCGLCASPRQEKQEIMSRESSAIHPLSSQGPSPLRLKGIVR